MRFYRSALSSCGFQAALCASLVALSVGSAGAQKPSSAAAKKAPRNVILFIADGLRYGAVNAKDSPTLWRLRTEGVDFRNGHSLFPTFTTANASAIATGHSFGDTGDFSNTIYSGYRGVGSVTPFLETDSVLTDLNKHYSGNYLGERTLLNYAKSQGYQVASVGKAGPTAIQQIEAVGTSEGEPAIIVDDFTGQKGGLPLPSSFLKKMEEAGVSTEAPTRSNGYGLKSAWNNGLSGDAALPGTKQANLIQLQWMTDTITKVLLPEFSTHPEKGFVLLFWSRDPDGTQHNQGDSLQSIEPGLDGPTTPLGLRNADRNLGQVMAWLDAHPAVKANTDIFVTSDHGFATISRREISLTAKTAAPSSKYLYEKQGEETAEEPAGTLPTGFLAVDLALALHTKMFDPVRPGKVKGQIYEELTLKGEKIRHPASGSALLGDEIRREDASDAKVIVAANGGSDLLYVPSHDATEVKRIAAELAKLDYVGGIFTSDAYGEIPGTVPMSHLGLVGATKLPQPDLVVSFKFFYRRPGDLLSAVQISDSSLQEGQGMHGGFGRDSTFNNMAAYGPDFKHGFVDGLPVSNKDIVPTIASIIGLTMPSTGTLGGRVIRESIRNVGFVPAPPAKQTESSKPSAGGLRTVVEYQEYGGERYNDRACFLRSEETSCPK